MTKKAKKGISKKSVSKKPVSKKRSKKEKLLQLGTAYGMAPPAAAVKVAATPKDTPKDAADLDSLWLDSGLGGDITDITHHKLLSISRRISSAPWRIRLTVALLKFTRTKSKTSSGKHITSSPLRCVDALMRRGRASSSRSYIATARRAYGRSSLRKTTSAITKRGSRHARPQSWA